MIVPSRGVCFVMSDVTTFESGFETSGEVQQLDVIPAGPARRSWAPEAKVRFIGESVR